MNEETKPSEQEPTLNRAVLLAKRAEYEQGQNQAVANANFYAGALSTMDALLALLDQQADALAKTETTKE